MPYRKRRAAAGIEISSSGSLRSSVDRPIDSSAGSPGSSAGSPGSSAGYEGGYEIGSSGGYEEWGNVFVCSIIRGSVFNKIDMQGAYSGVNPCPVGKLAAFFF